MEVTERSWYERVPENKNALYFVIATYITLQTAKTVVIRKLERARSIGTFLRTPRWF